MRIGISINDDLADMFRRANAMNFDTVGSRVTCYAIEKRVSNPKVCRFILLIIFILELIWKILGGCIQLHLSKLAVTCQGGQET